MAIFDGERFADLAREHDVPGASLAIWADGQLTQLATGLLHTGTGVETTVDSLFQVGSITKPYTATLLMRLVEQGLATVDTPVAELLPGFRLADPETTSGVTLRHLLTHTSGINGDFFHDTGRGDDCLAAYVRALADVPVSHPLGATLSYCNAGFVVAGRIIEQLTGLTWDAALHEYLLRPLGVTHTWTLPEEVLRFRTSMGHIAMGDGPLEPAPQWGLMRSAGPAGLINATAADIIAFARLHLDGGVTTDGTRLLAAESVAEMARAQVVVPHPDGIAHHWGLGWAIFDWDGRRVIGHDGDTIGQAATLRLVPDAGVAMAVLTNSTQGGSFRRNVASEVLSEVCGVTVPRSLEPPDNPPQVDLSRHTGVYERAGIRFEFSIVDGRLMGHAQPLGELAHLSPSYDAPLIPLSADEFAVKPPGFTQWSAFSFYSLPDGSPYVHDGSRATPKVSS